MWDDNETAHNGATDHSKGKGMKSGKVHNKGNMSRKMYSNTAMGAKGSEKPCSDCAGHDHPKGSGFTKGKSSPARVA